MPLISSLIVNYTTEGLTDGKLALVMEVDGEKTQFYPGDDYPFRIYYTGTLFVVAATWGTVTSNGSGARNVDKEWVDFNGLTGSLQYPASSGFSGGWSGIVLDADGNSVAGEAPKLLEDKQTLSLDEPRYGTYQVAYTAAYTKKKLTGVPTDQLRVKITAGVK